jgi:hypothetical protein
VLFVCTVYSVLCSEIAVSRNPFGIGHMYINISFLLRMTSQNIDLSSWDNLYIYIYIYIVCAVLSIGSSFAMGLSLVQGVLPSV